MPEKDSLRVVIFGKMLQWKSQPELPVHDSPLTAYRSHLSFKYLIHTPIGEYVQDRRNSPGREFSGELAVIC